MTDLTPVEAAQRVVMAIKMGSLRGSDTCDVALPIAEKLQDVIQAAELVRTEWRDRGDGGCELRIRNLLVAALSALSQPTEET